MTIAASIYVQGEGGRTLVDNSEYRLAVFGRPTGPWHADKASAQRYAVKRKLASYDAGLGVTFMDVSASLIQRARP